MDNWPGSVAALSGFLFPVVSDGKFLLAIFHLYKFSI